jgi:hypothetical protein
VFTQALIDHGTGARDMLVLELKEELHQHLMRQFPQARVVCGDAGNLRQIARGARLRGRTTRRRDHFRPGTAVDARQTQQAILQAGLRQPAA